MAGATKDQVAALAEICLDAAAEPGADADCAALVRSQAGKLSQTAAETVASLRAPPAAGAGESDADDGVEVLLYGGLFASPTYRDAFSEALAAKQPDVSTRLPERASVFGALEMAALALSDAGSEAAPNSSSAAAEPEPAACFVPPLAALGVRSPTELRNPLSTSLDTMATEEAIGLFLEQDALLPSKILPHAATLAELVRAVTKAFKEGGRLLYCGAGTSGRLGCLDAAE